MRFHQPLDTIFDSGSKVRILRFFCRKGGEWNGRRMAATLGMNPVTAHKALRGLHQATILEFRRVGNSFVYALRDDHWLVRGMLRPLFRREAHAPERLRERLRQRLDARLQSDVLTMAIYGSVARQRERPTSDIDLLVVVRSAQAKRRVGKSLGRVWETVAKEFGNPLAPYVNTVREGQQKVHRRLPIFLDILARHHVVWGRPLEEVLGGRAP